MRICVRLSAFPFLRLVLECACVRGSISIMKGGQIQYEPEPGGPTECPKFHLLSEIENFEAQDAYETPWLEAFLRFLTEYETHPEYASLPVSEVRKQIRKQTVGGESLYLSITLSL